MGIATNKPQEIQKAVKTYPENQKTIASGDSLIRFIHKSGYGVDIKIVKPEEWGSLLQHFTGSKSHNIALREFAMKKGLSLSEYGIKNIKTKKIKQFADEKHFYSEIGLPWIPPEIRENTIELELAKQNNLPDLVEQGDIKGDFHVHSISSWKSSHDESNDSLESTIATAIQMNYKFIGIADHNPSSHYNESQLQKLFKKRKQIFDQLKKKYPLITIYNSLEVDIKPNGLLAISDALLESFDYVVASVHSNLTMDEVEMTNRIITALSHKKVKILGHPTGKLLQKRAGYTLNWSHIFSACKKNRVALEINASPTRLDIDELIVKEAIKNGIKIAINTDAHAITHLNFMKFGVYVARRGYATKKDCLNCSNKPF